MTTSENLALVCESCNIHKAVATEGWAGIEEHLSPLYHPHLDLWREHFQYERETNYIVGLDLKGRVNVNRSKMNSPYQLRARQQW